MERSCGRNNKWMGTGRKGRKGKKGSERERESLLAGERRDPGRLGTNLVG